MATYNCKMSGSVIPAAWPAACWRLMAWWIESWRSESLGAAGMAVATAARVATRADLSETPAIFGSEMSIINIDAFPCFSRVKSLLIEPASREGNRKRPAVD